MSIKKDLVIVGGGPAGLAAAIGAREAGIEDLVILEREHQAGGILRQCIHNGFGLHRFGEELTGPEYAQRDINRAEELGLDIRCDTTVLAVDHDRRVTCVSAERGVEVFEAGAVVLAMGCRERPRGALGTPGTRCAGVYTAGTAQRFVNLMGEMPGKRVVILGSGDIGLIMARRMTLQGAKIEGRERLTGVTVSAVDERRRPIPGTEKHFDCDTLLLSVGLIPENELSRGAGVELSPVTSGAVVDDSLATSIPGVFACGNVLHVHDLVDHVSNESFLAGRAAAAFIREGEHKGASVRVLDGKGVRGVVPQRIRLQGDNSVDVQLMFRPDAVYKNAAVVAECGGQVLAKKRAMIFTPGEMAVLPLKAEALKGVAGDITVRMDV